MKSNRNSYKTRIALSAAKQLAHCSGYFVRFCWPFVLCLLYLLLLFSVFFFRFCFIYFLFYFAGDFYLNTARFLWHLSWFTTRLIKIKENTQKKRGGKMLLVKNVEHFKQRPAGAEPQLQLQLQHQEPHRTNSISVLLDSFICSYGNGQWPMAPLFESRTDGLRRP